ncbi:MAG: hypothetical protein FWC39_00350 [Bacteroidetes bacterium]|nr:hypothetical protein [Bacteroidota bacterium]
MALFENILVVVGIVLTCAYFVYTFLIKRSISTLKNGMALSNNYETNDDVEVILAQREKNFGEYYEEDVYIKRGNSIADSFFSKINSSIENITNNN